MSFLAEVQEAASLPLFTGQREPLTAPSDRYHICRALGLAPVRPVGAFSPSRLLVVAPESLFAPIQQPFVFLSSPLRFPIILSS